MGQNVVSSSIQGCFDYSAVCCVSAACGYPWTLGPNDRPDFYGAAFEWILDCFCSQKPHKMHIPIYSLNSFKMCLRCSKRVQNQKTKSLNYIRYKTAGCRPHVLLCFCIVSTFKLIRFTLHVKEKSNFFVGHFMRGSALMKRSSKS